MTATGVTAPARTPGRDDVPLGVRKAPPWVDAALGLVAAGLAVVVLLTTDLTAIDPALRVAPLWVIALTFLGALGTGLRRRAPLAGLLLVGFAATVISLGSYYTGLLPYLTLFGLYSVAAHATRRQAITGISLMAASFVGLVASGVPDLTVGDVVTSVALGVAAVALGDSMRLRRAHQLDQLTAALLDSARAQAESERALAESERAQAESERALAESARMRAESRRSVADERLRIARELHDVVAHSMSLIAVQAGVGAHLIDRDPAAASHALEVIADTSRDALAQARSVIGLLRSGDDAQPSMPGLAALEPLVQGVRDAGLPVELAVAGPVRDDLPAAVDLAAYRIVQEALTNAVRHAPQRPVSVRLERTGPDLRIDVHDRAAPPRRGPETGTEPEPPAVVPARTGGSGYGLLGLAERAAAVGGELTAGPTVEGGFRLSARLPVGGGA